MHLGNNSLYRREPKNHYTCRIEGVCIYPLSPELGTMPDRAFREGVHLEGVHLEGFLCISPFDPSHYICTYRPVVFASVSVSPV